MVNLDSYFDPPEGPEPPECPKCKGGDTDLIKDTPTHYVLMCYECGHIWKEGHPQEPDPPAEDGEVESWEPEQIRQDCPHGNDPADCDACAHLGDLAYDAQRERRMFR